MAITSFREGYFFLSNFYPAAVKLDGIEYPTVEHAFQAAKTCERAVREAFLLPQYAKPGAAKRLGRSITLRKDWEEVKDFIMKRLLWDKFVITSKNKLAHKLIETYPRQLIEGNTWGDRYWGAEEVRGQWIGQNKLGLMLMGVRDAIIELAQNVPPVDTRARSR